MKRKSEKALSAVISSLMAASVISAVPMSVQAKTEVKNQSEQFEEQVRQIYKSKRLKLGDIKENSKLINDNLPRIKEVNPEEKVRVIVEVNEKSLSDYVAKGQSLEMACKNSTLMKKISDSRLPLKRMVRNINSNIKLRQEYSILINGFSAEVQYKDIEKIKELPGVKHVTLAKKYYPDMNVAKSLTGAEGVWKNLKYKGEGLVVSVIDTGIDWNHKDMKLSKETSGKEKLKKADIDKMQNDKGQWYTQKVPYGYNFADQNNEVVDKTSSMHGMHVSGIVGANCQSEEEIKQNRGIKGVAPEAQLLAMKVFSNDPKGGGAFADDIVAAIDDSVAHGADVINMSLGSNASFQDPEDAEQKAIKRATEKGTVVVVSAGNSQYALAPYRFPGVNDTGLVGSPGLAEDSLQVASFENNTAVYPAVNVMLDGKSEEMAYTSSGVNPLGVLNGELELVDCGKGIDEFAGKDLKGKIALIQRGVNTFVEKQINAQAAGAAGVIIYNKDGEETFISMATDEKIKIPCIFIRNLDGLKLKTNITKAKLSFKDIVKSVENINKGDMSDFTSWGPTPNLDFKPEITAPGGQIWSTVNNNKYENMSGTSMASPHMAGSMALIMQHINQIEKDNKMSFANTKERAEFAKKLSVNTAKVMMEKEDANMPFSPRRQGAGMVDTEAAIRNNVTVEFEENKKPVVALKEIGSERTFKLKLHNYGKDSVTYNVKPLDDRVLTETNKELEGDMSYDMEIRDSKVIPASDTITVQAGKDAEVGIVIKMPQNAPKDIFAEGFIRFIPQKADGKENKDVPELGVPFIGFYGDWGAMDTIDKPMWSGKSILTEKLYKDITSTLLTTDSKGDYNFLGITGEDKDKNPIIDEDKIAISNTGKGNNGVVPLIAPLRNIKEMDVQILNDKGEVVRTIAKDTEIKKVVLSDPHEKGFRLNPNWKWDGLIYDKATGEYEKAPDGQYTLRIANRVDYKDAKVQNFDMKVKVDSVGPEVSIVSDGKSQRADNTYTLKFKAEDLGAAPSGIKGFVFMVNSKMYKDEKGEPLFTKIQKDKEGYYSFDMNLNKDVNNIQIAAIDYAGNIGLCTSEAAKDGFTTSIVKDGKVVEDILQLKDGNFDLLFSINDLYVNNVKKVYVLLDSKKYETIDIQANKKQYLVNFNNLTPGKHILAVKGESEGKFVVTKRLGVQIQDSNFEIKVSDLQSGMSVNKTTYKVEGSVTAVPDVFKINDKDVEVSKLLFKHDVELKANAVNEIRIYAKKGDKEYNYAYKVMCDPVAPEINLELPKGVLEKDGEVVIKVPETVEKYILKGNVKDDGFGYRFSINGEAIHQVSTDVPNPKKTNYNFEQEIDLTSNTTIITLYAEDECGNKTTKIVKIVKNVKDVKDVGALKIERINMKDSYVSGEQFKGGIRVTNTTEQTKSSTLVVGVFNDKNQMVNVASVSQLIGAGVSIDLSTVLTIPQEGNYTIRCFVWDSMESMLPLSEVIQVPVIGNVKDDIQQPAQPENKGNVLNPEVPLNPSISGTIENPQKLMQP